MMMFWIFLMIDLVTVGIFYAVYGRKQQYSEGMLMGVHMPQSAAESEEVTAFIAKYTKRSHRFYFWNTVAGALISALNFWYMSVFMLMWSLWLVELCVGGILLLYRTHRKLYDLKVERGWVGSGGSHILAAGTKTSTQTGKMGISPWWHTVLTVLILLPCLLPYVRDYLKNSDDGWVLLIVSVSVETLFAVLHVIMLRMQDKVYSEDAALNDRVNGMRKQTWSRMLLGCGICNAAAYLTAAQFMDGKGWLGSGVYVAYIILESFPIVLLLGGFFYMAKRKYTLLAQNQKPLYIDDDVYWKNGWYSNPNDKRLIVQDWVCTWNYATNMARPAGKISLAAGLLIGVGCLVVAVVMIFKMEFTPIEVRISTDEVAVTSGYSDLFLTYDEITDVELLDSLPKDDYRRVNGGDDGRMLVGKFRGKETGKCRMYLYVGYEPILMIGTEDGPAYINSKTDGEARQWEKAIRDNLTRLAAEEH